MFPQQPTLLSPLSSVKNKEESWEEKQSQGCLGMVSLTTTKEAKDKANWKIHGAPQLIRGCLSGPGTL